ncbi:MAG: DUF1232 domain-containing protein [Anaerolineae bacterium]|nr:MAG: DUF1232 domain-containing protein [Anaerolineae bacterium]
MNETNPTPEQAGLLSQLFEQFGLAARLFLDGRVPTLNKLLLPLLVLAYVVFPVDLLPDFIPGLGQLDDLAVILVAVRLFVMLAPKDVVAQYRNQEETEPVASGAADGTPHRAPMQGNGNVVDATYRFKD